MANWLNITRCCCCCWYCFCCSILPILPEVFTAGHQVHCITWISVFSTVDHCCVYTLSPLSYSPFCIWTVPSHRTIARLLLTINNHFFHSWCILTCDLIMKKKNLQRRKVLDIACNWRVAFVGLIKCYLYIWSLKIVFYHNIFKSSFIYFLLLIYFLWNNAQILKMIEFSVKSKHICTHTSNKNSR